MDYDELERIANNPSRAINGIFRDIEKSFVNGEGGINSKGDPFSYSTDLIVGYGNVFLRKLEDQLATEYKCHARTISDLTKHMSDEDWDGIFSTPSTTKVNFIIDEEEIKKKAIPFEVLDGELLNKYRKLVIPKDTIITIMDTDFWLEHAVEIRVMEYGGIQIVYDTTQTSPFSDLNTNYPEREIYDLNSSRKVVIKLPLKQISIKEIPNKSSNEMIGYNSTVTFTDKLYKVRAFIKPNNSNIRKEMTVIYNRDNFDPFYPTLQIDLLNSNQFRATIPPVYLQNGLGIGTVTLLVYTTKGAYERNLTTIQEEYHKSAYFNYNNPKGQLGPYELPFRTMDTVLINSIESISGGRNGRTFEEVKETMIYKHRRRDLPITSIDITQNMSFSGYETIKSIDYPNNRLYRITKDLPKQTNKVYSEDELVNTNSNVGTYVGSILTSLVQLRELNVGINNGSRHTLTPWELFDITNPSATLISKAERTKLLNSSSEYKIDYMANKTMVGNPFYYVLDTTNDQARMRAYHLDNPKIIDQTFYYENPYLGIGLGINSDSVVIRNENNSYVIELVTKSSEEYKKIPDEELGLQLAFDVNNGSAKKTMRGTLLGKNKDGERKWRFVLETNFDIDQNNLLDLKGMNQYGDKKETVRVKLNEVANFIFTFNSENQKNKSNSDRKIDQTLFPNTHIAIIETEFNISFGTHLKYLYTSVRPMVDGEIYETYKMDIPDTYSENEYKYENGELVLENNLPVILHKKGDVIKNSDGTISYKYIKGDAVRDENGELVLLEGKKLSYYWDFIGLDYNYYLSEDEYDKEYLNSVRDTLAINIMKDLTNFNTITNERTFISFKPKSTMGYTNVIINQGIQSQIKNDFRFTVVYYLTKEGYEDRNLKTALRNNTHKVINDTLRLNTVGNGTFVQALKTNTTQSSVIDIKLTAWSGEDEIEVITNVDNTNGFSVTKELELTADRLLAIKEKIDVIFKKHIG